MIEKYRTVYLPKSKGQYREIYIIGKPDRDRLRSYLPYLQERIDELDSTCSVVAFRDNRNCAFNAKQHLGYAYTLSLDIEDFFDSVSEKHLKGLVSDEIITECLIEGSPKQGLPTSPQLANIALVEADTKIIEAIQGLVGAEFVYTRYADDLFFSFYDSSYAPLIEQLVGEILKDLGFELNERKTHLQSAQNGRVVITGIALDHKKIRPTRKTQKKIRAAAHQGHSKSLRGLQEWASCKLPTQFSDNEPDIRSLRIDSLEKIMRRNGLEGIPRVSSLLEKIAVVEQKSERARLTLGGWDEREMGTELRVFRQMELEKLPFESLHHMTHMNNIENILAKGLKSHNNPYKLSDISNPSVNQRRLKREPCYGRRLHEYVPFYFNVRNAMMFDVQQRHGDRIVILSFRKELLFDRRALFSSQNAASKDPEITQSILEVGEYNWKKIFNDRWSAKGVSNKTIKSKMMSECLLYGGVNQDHLYEIVCQTSKVKTHVQSLVALVDYHIDVVLKPEAFFET